MDRASGTGTAGLSKGETLATGLPSVVKWTGWLGIAEGIIGILVGFIFAFDAFRGKEEKTADVQGVFASWGSVWGTALWFFIMFGAVAAGGWALTRGKRWGRAPVMMLNMLLLPIAWYMFSSSRFDLAIPTLLVALVGLGLLFSPAAARWSAARYGM